MAFDVAAARSEGYSDQEIAEHLAKSKGYDLSNALKEGYTPSQVIEHLAGSKGPDQGEVQKGFNINPAVGAAYGTGVGTAAALASAATSLAARRLGIPQIAANAPPVDGIPVLRPNVLQRPHEVAERFIAQGQANNPYAPKGPSDVINWSSGKGEGTGQYGRGYMGGASQEIEANLQRQADALEARNPGFKVVPGDPNLQLKPAAEVDQMIAKRAADMNTYNQQVEARANAAAEVRRQKLGELQAGRKSVPYLAPQIPGKIASSLPVAGGALGYNVMDLINRSDDGQGVTPQDVVSGAGALGSLTMPFMNKLPPKAKWLAPAVGLGAPLVNKGLDYIQERADGGSIKKALGVLPKMVRQANLRSMTSKSVEPQQMYHGTKASITGDQGITQFRPNPETGLTFVTPDPKFAERYMYTPGKGTEGGAIYPVNVQVANPFDYQNAQHVNSLADALKKPSLRSEFASGDWRRLEYPETIKAIKGLGHDAMYVEEYGTKNLGLFDPNKIKSSIGNRGTYDTSVPDINMASGGSVPGYADGKSVTKLPEKIVKAYKLFRTNPKEPGTIYPLFVNAKEPVPIGEWVDAKAGEMVGDRVKSTLGTMAYRPGWHAGDVPASTHIGGISDPKTMSKPNYRKNNEVWAEVEMPADVDWQSIALERAARNKQGEIIPKTAHITDQVPFGGHYRYKTNPNMTGDWMIGGSMKVNRILADDEVRAINEAAGVSDLPRFTPLKEFDKSLRKRIEEAGGSPPVEGFAQGGLSTPAWQRSEGKNPEGGLNAAGRASYNRETGGNLQPPVSSEAAKSSPKKAARRKSFCARMEGNPGPMKDENGKPTRKALALRKWDC